MFRNYPEVLYRWREERSQMIGCPSNAAKTSAGPFARGCVVRGCWAKRNRNPGRGVSTQKESYHVSRQLCTSCAGVVCPAATRCFPATADSTFIQINLVLDVMGRAENYDPNLKDPWGSIRFFGRWIFGRAERTTIQMRCISPRVTTINMTECSGRFCPLRNPERLR
jgi:hypothetical protein